MIEIPASFRIFGFGEDTKPAIDQLTALGYDGVSVSMVNKEEPTPSDMDKMAILLVGRENKTALEVAKTFHDADILTLVVSTPDTPFETSVCDSLTVCKPEEMAETVASLLNAIVKPCMICFDFNDMNTLLEDSMHFKVGSSERNGVDRVRNAMYAAMDGLVNSNADGLERMAILLYINPDSMNPIQMDEISAIPELIQTFPESIDVVWGVYNDTSIEADAVKIIVIASGKEMTL